MSSPALTASAVGRPAPRRRRLGRRHPVRPPGPGASTAASAATFLPTQLVVGVADDLRSATGSSRAGWGSRGATPAAGPGRRCDGTYANSPAAAHLQAGEVIVAVNAQPVRSFAELRSRLYVEPPGSSVDLSVQGVPGASGTKAVVVTLASDS